jgi:hypothetical protein
MASLLFVWGGGAGIGLGRWGKGGKHKRYFLQVKPEEREVSSLRKVTEQAASWVTHSQAGFFL